MKKIFCKYLFYFFSLAFCQPSFSQIGGSSTYEFLNLSVPARVAAVGGTLISVKDNDVNLSFQNPGLLDSTMHNQLSMSYIDYFTDIRYGYAAYSRYYRNIGNFSAGIQFLDYGNFIAANNLGEITGNFKAADYCLNLSYSRPVKIIKSKKRSPVDSMFAVGATLKTIYSKLGEYTSYGNAIDVGGIYNNRKKLFSAALVIKNVGKQWKTYHVVHEPLPFEIQVGVSKKLAHAPFRFSITATHLEKWDLTYVDPLAVNIDPITNDTIQPSKVSKFADKLARHFVLGGEILLTKNFNLRVGYNYERRQELKLESHPGIAGFSFGFGIKISKFHLSYGYAEYHAAGGPNHITITTNFSEFYSKKQ